MRLPVQLTPGSLFKIQTRLCPYPAGVCKGHWRKSGGVDLGRRGLIEKETVANLWIVLQLEMQPTVLPVQRIWTSFCFPSVCAQQLGEVAWKLGGFFGGRGVGGLGELALPRGWPLLCKNF